MKNLIKKFGTNVYDFINNGGWKTVLLVGVFGISLCLIGMGSTIINIFLDKDYKSLIFVVVVDFVVISVLIFAIINIFKLIKNNKDIFGL